MLYHSIKIVQNMQMIMKLPGEKKSVTNIQEIKEYNFNYIK